MSQGGDIFSLRLVIAEFYLEKPVLGLDPCYSEFRGSNIKKVPIIRIFGSNSYGRKTCMHIHGVFPYFYIPYEKKDFESLNKAIYQIAFSLDKAINVSLGQGSSTAQHVFKIQLVKGIPFYGYHRLEHQYLKIYMYNPRFVRRAANLLQNGSILGKIFHPHESHVPYVLQFMIDYNLYGMSFLHVPLEVVKFRKKDEKDSIAFSGLKKTQILNLDLVKKQACSSLEVDIGSNFILNRFQLAVKNTAGSKHSNPGVEAIWHDEDIRREKLRQIFDGDEGKINAIPRLEIPPTQGRPNVQPTDSDVFYRAGLLSKLMSLEETSSGSGSLLDQTLNTTLQVSQQHTTLNVAKLDNKEMRRTFNLKKLLANSVYPEECTPDEELVDASCIENHLSAKNIFQTSSSEDTEAFNSDEANNTLVDESAFLDDTIVDEDLIMELTQQKHVPLNASLRIEDMKLLNVLQQLEEQNKNRNSVDLDNLLAPLSQPQKDLRIEDMELLNVLQQLEEQNENRNSVDLDSSLAPLSQPHKDFELTPDVLDKETIAAASNQLVSDNESESENEDNSNLHDFSIVLDDIDELLLKISQSQSAQNTKIEDSEENKTKLPQLDGVDDYLAKTPEKLRHSFKIIKQQVTPPHSPRTPKPNGSSKSPVRSPRTPKSNASVKYAPLPIVINSRSVQKTHKYVENGLPKMESKRLNFDTTNAKPSSPQHLRKKLAITKMRRKTISSANDFLSINGLNSAENVENKSTVSTRRSRKNSVDLEKTHITCALTPRRKSERLLKTCHVDEIPKKIDSASLKRKKSEQKNVKKLEIHNNIDAKETKETKTHKRKFAVKKLVVNLVRTDLLKMAAKFQEDQKIEKGKQVVGKKHIEKLESTPTPNKELKAKNLSAKESIQKNRSQDCRVVEQNPERNFEKSESFKSVNAQENFSSNISNNLFNSYKSFERINLNNNSELVLDKVKLQDNNIRNNLSQLYKLFHDTNVNNNNNNNVSETKENDNEEEIITSDTECATSISKFKSTPICKRSRFSLLSRRAMKTPKTPNTSTTINICDLSISVNSPSVFSEYLSPVLTPVFSEYLSPVLTPKITPENNEIKNITNSEQVGNLNLLNSSNSPLSCGQSLNSKACQISDFQSLQALSSLPKVNNETNSLILHPLILPPTRQETLKACEKLQIYEYEFQCPFYSNPEDITKAKEIGFTLLQIQGNKLNDCPEFQSVLGSNLKGLTNWRREKLQEIGGTQALHNYKTAERMREFFATKREVIIEPHIKPPSRQEAKIWLKARELLQNKEKEKIQVEQDSPIKIRRQKVTMMFNDEMGTTDDANDMDNTSCSLTLTPLTPATPGTSLSCSKLQLKNTELTPLSTNDEKLLATDSSSTSCLKRLRPKRLKSVRISLNEKLKAVTDKELNQNKPNLTKLKESTEHIASLSSSQQSNRSSDDSSSVCSQIALAALERSSFTKRLKSENLANKNDRLDVSFGLTSASLNNTFGFKVNLENLQEAKADIESNNLTTIVVELFVPTRDDLCPNPEFDEIHCIFYAVENNVPIKDVESDANGTLSPPKACGYILVNDPRKDIIQNEGKIHGIDADIQVKIVKSEIEALEALLALCAYWDADIYAGYEIEMASWGYIIERAKNLGLNIAPQLSRVPTQKLRDSIDEEREHFTEIDIDIETKLCGRILLDVWRLMRSEIALTSYTFENVMYHILHKRCPWHSYRVLTEWFASPCSRWIVLEYYLERVRGILALLDQLDLLGRTSEMAKLIGIQFYEVLSRGSQFRVESMMLRIAKPRNLVPLSPSVKQRAHMRAPEYLPLILEPQSRFYADPVIVLDFQSLYPSMIIAYNYCFSTCLGRVEHLGQSTPFEFGASQLRVSPKMLRKLLDEDLINISPCGVVFVKSKVREGILPRMLTEILDTRQMVKQSMKLHKSNSALQRILHSRQLGLKLMANVTYGYTAANFSGRMPAVEVGDSVVAKGRETLERTIKMVEANEKWGVKVVYGDTDSLFVQVPGRNREQAFKIGEEIAAAATKVNPHPVKLKLEKVYQPCILQTKKRYVGYMYETPDQTEPVYEAKGIETVRRDGCPAVAKMLEKVLRILFETTDVSQVKQYVCRQFTKLLSGRANLQDLIFAKEFRGLNGYKPTACVPALEMTRKWIQTDPRHIPRRGERVPFIITNGPPGVPLIRLIRSPHEVLADVGLKINAIYYITKAIIPPLNRCLLLIGADVNEWFANLPRKILMTPALSIGNEMITGGGGGINQQKKSTISQYFSTTNCIIDCGNQTKDGICNECKRDDTKCVITLKAKIAKIERTFHLTQNICQACCGRVGDLICGSLDCPVLYVLEVKKRELHQIEHFQKLLDKF